MGGLPEKEAFIESPVSERLLVLIAGSPPISLSLIVGESKWDAKASGTHRILFFF